MPDRYPAMPPRDPDPPYKRIATEEAWLPPDMMRMYLKELADKNIDDPGFHSLWGFFTGSTRKARDHSRRIQSLGEERISDMDSSGIDIAVVSLTAPGVQLFDPETATSLAVSANDQLAEGIARYPDRYVGLAAFSPLDPANAAKELERGVKQLGLRGGIFNSHTLGTYLDDEQYWEIFEAAEALDVPDLPPPPDPVGADDRAVPEARPGRGGLRFRLRDRTSRAQADGRRAFRQISQAADRPRPLRRGAALLALPHRLHARPHFRQSPGMNMWAR